MDGFFFQTYWYGFTQAVATEYFLEIWRPAETSSSVMVGWRREWSIILASSGRETVRVLGRELAMVRMGIRVRMRFWVYERA
jgi:hypothetical protein